MPPLLWPPPPNELTELPLKVLRSTLRRPALFKMPPPLSAELVLRVLFWRVRVARSLKIPPPAPAELPLRALFWMVSVPLVSLNMPPPLELDELPLTMLLLTVKTPWFRMPAPEPERVAPDPLPLVMVRPASKAVTPEFIENTRLRPLPLMARFVAPGPRIVRFLRTTNSPLVSTMVRPFKAGSKVMVLPGQESATAPRNEPMPPSLVLVTIKLLTQTSTRNTQEFVPTMLVALQVTRVLPSPKRLPEGGTQVTTGAGKPFVATVQETATEFAPLARFVARLPGHVKVGAMACSSKKPTCSVSGPTHTQVEPS